MNEVALPQTPGGNLAMNSAPLGALPQTSAVIQLAEWAAELEAAHRIGKALAASNFLPKSLCEMSGGAGRKDPDQLAADAAAVILAGKSVGLDPLQSVQNIFPVYGMPAMYARTMGALVIAQGHEVRRTVATNEAVTYAVRRKGDKDWQEFTWTIERAGKAGYLKNKKYESDPIAMLGAKALTEACRIVFSDILLGMPYSVEDMELEDMGEQPATSSVRQAMAATQQPAAPAQEPAAPAKQRKSSVARAQQAAQEPAPAEEPPAAPLVEMVTPEQWTHLSAALMAAGFKTKPTMGKAIEEQLNRTTSGPDDITAQEAADLIEFFNGSAGAPAALDTAPAYTQEDDAAWLAKTSV